MGAEQSRAAHPSRRLKDVLAVWHASSRFEQNSPGNPSNTLRTLVACSGGDLSHSALAPPAHVSNLFVVGPPAGPLAFGLGRLAFPSSGCVCVCVCVLLRLRVCASSFAHLACSGSLGLFLHRFANLGVLIVRPIVVPHSLCALSSSSGHHAPVPSRRPAPAANPSSPGWWWWGGGAANRMRPHVGMDESADGFGMGVLPYQACSCNALLALLVRWGFFTERLGGLLGAGEKAACSELLTALLRELYGEGDLKVTLALDDDWVNVWPRPDCSRNVATLRICSDGILGLGGLEEVCENMTACRWRQHLVSVAGADLRIGNVLARAGVHKPLSSLFRQLVWHLGHKLQSSIMAAFHERHEGQLCGGRGVAARQALGALHRVAPVRLRAAPADLDRHRQVCGRLVGDAGDGHRLSWEHLRRCTPTGALGVGRATSCSIRGWPPEVHCSSGLFGEALAMSIHPGVCVCVCGTHRLRQPTDSGNWMIRSTMRPNDRSPIA